MLSSQAELLAKLIFALSIVVLLLGLLTGDLFAIGDVIDVVVLMWVIAFFIRWAAKPKGKGAKAKES